MFNSESWGDPLPQIITRIPQRGQTRKQWDFNITSHLCALWLERTPTADQKIISIRNTGWLFQMSPEALHALDEIIIREAVTLGWWIHLSEWVLWRESEWGSTPDGLKRYQRLHHAIERAARIHQQLEKPPLDDPGLYRFKRETVKELRVVLREMRGDRQIPSWLARNDAGGHLVADFLRRIKPRSKSLPFLATNLTRWEAFLNQQPDELRVCPSAARFRPANLFDSWFSWCKGIDQEWARQVISRLGSSLRKPAASLKL